MAKRSMDESEFQALRDRVRRERLELKREIARMDDEQRQAVEEMFEQCKQRDLTYSQVLVKRPKSDSMRRHYEEVLLAEAVNLVKHPPKPTGEELARSFMRDLLAQMRVGADFEDIKAWAKINYPDVARHWK